VAGQPGGRITAPRSAGSVTDVITEG